LKRNGIVFVALLFLCITMLSGCWSKKELTDLAFVIAVGLDKTEDGKYAVIFQIVNPGNVAGTTQRGGGSGGVPISLCKATGDTLLEASRKGSKKVSRLIYYAHTNLLVIGEELAKEGIGGVLDVMERSNQFRTTTMVVIAQHHTAEDVLKVLTPIDKIPANEIIKTLKFSEKIWGQTVRVNVGEVINDLVSPGKEPVVSGTRLVGSVQKGKRQTNVQASEPDTRLNMDGLAIFKEGKLVGWASGEIARGVLWVLDKIDQTTITLEWKKKKEAVAYKVIRSKTSVAAKIRSGKPTISIRIEAEGDIGETLVPIDFTKTQPIFALEKKIEQEIKKEVMGAVKLAKRETSDIFGFGDAIYRSYPHEWKMMKQRWNDEYFPELDVNVTVDAFIRRTGLRSKPYTFKP
jgi:spore germination protein KC